MLNLTSPARISHFYDLTTIYFESNSQSITAAGRLIIAKFTVLRLLPRFSSINLHMHGNINNFRGFSLLEVLIAVFIFALSMLSLLYFATTAWRRTYDAHLISLGVINATNRAEAERAQDNGWYHLQWQQNLEQILPQGKGTFDSKGKDKSFAVTVCWQQLFQAKKFCYQLSEYTQSK